MIRYAVLSDIHSNLWALEAVLADAKQRAADRLINLGDILYGPLAPAATYQRLQQESFITIQGNQDRQIYQADSAEIAANPTLQFILDDLPAEALSWMRGLDKRQVLAADDLFLCHGIPDDDMVYLLEDVSSGVAQVRSDQQIRQLLGDVSNSLVLCGHTHLARAVSLPGGQLIVNPGSVGLPAYQDDLPVVHKMENFSALASYAMVEKGTEGWRVEFIKVPYDTTAAVAAAEARQRLDWAHALKTGRVQSEN